MRRTDFLFAVLALIGGGLLVFGLHTRPTYTDAYYHFNAAVRIASGQGFVDEYLWNYIGMPESLPVPSHRYWMPLTSILAALGMQLWNAPGSYAAALTGFWLMLWGGALLGYWLGWRITGSRRAAWIAGVLTLGGGFFGRFWGQTDTFAPYLLLGAGALLAMGQGLRTIPGRSRWWLLAGALAALGHLTRSDGLLLVLVAAWVLLLNRGRTPARRLRDGLIFGAAYLIVMLPWFAHSLVTQGAILPVGGTQSIWYTTYDDLFAYPPDASPATFFAAGSEVVLGSRLEGLAVALQTFIAVEGFVALAPLILLALWRRRREPLLQPVLWFALGIHLAFALVFTFPGMRGGLFHAVAALLPFWAALGMAGLEDAVLWMARRRRKWRPAQALAVFSVGALVLGLAITLALILNRARGDETPPVYPALLAAIPQGARVMANDVAALYYFTGLGGVVLPNEAPQVLPEIARRYEIAYLLLEPPDIPQPLLFDFEAPPDFLRALPLEVPGVYLYAFELD